MNVDTQKSGTELVQYFERRLTVLTKHFINTQQCFGMEDLHQLRVEIKKLRAFLRMLELVTGKSFQKTDHYRLLAIIFKPGGRLRETQINLSLVGKYTSYLVPYYKVFLVKRESKQKEKLKVALNDFDISEFDRLNKLVIPYLELTGLNILEERGLRFIAQEMETINSLRPGISNQKDLHKIRMHLKAMGYITKLMNEMKPDEKLAASLLAIKPTETMIGNWHDRVVLVLSLKRFLRKNEDNPNKNEILRLIAQIEKKNVEAVEEIGLRLDEILI